MRELSELFPAFAARMQALLSPDDYAAYLRALASPPLRYARVNPRKPISTDLLVAELGDFPFLPAEARPGAGALHAAGAYYVQEPAAAACAEILSPLLPRGARVLDLCAAPGGKVTAAAAAREDCLFVANEIVFARAKILLGNVERMGLDNCVVTSLRPDEIARRTAGCFDAVIADVPCSGEGMLRKTDFYGKDLSDDAVLSCAVRARKILESADASLRAGGLLAFSTCTFNRTENEAQADWLVRELGYEPVRIPLPPHARESDAFPCAIRFFPQDGGGEGHFYCLFRKTREGATCRPRPCIAPVKRDKARAVTKLLREISCHEFAEDGIYESGEGFDCLPPDEATSALPALRRGVRLATECGRLVPHHHFAACADRNELRRALDYAPDAPQVAAYLRGESFACNGTNGFAVLCVASLPLGLVKIADGQAKNHYPKGLRLR